MRCPSECLEASHLCVGCSRHLDRHDLFFDAHIRLCRYCSKVYREWVRTSDGATDLPETIERLVQAHPTIADASRESSNRGRSRSEAFREEVALAETTGDWELPALWLLRELQLASDDVLPPDGRRIWLEICQSVRKGAAEGPRSWDFIQKHMARYVRLVPNEHLKAVEAALVKLLPELR